MTDFGLLCHVPSLPLRSVSACCSGHAPPSTRFTAVVLRRGGKLLPRAGPGANLHRQSGPAAITTPRQEAAVRAGHGKHEHNCGNAARDFLPRELEGTCSGRRECQPRFVPRWKQSLLHRSRYLCQLLL